MSDNLDLEVMSREQLLDEVKKLRVGIREDASRSGHDLCWYRPELWNLVPGLIRVEPEVPPREEFLYRCGLYRDSLERKNLRESEPLSPTAEAALDLGIESGKTGRTVYLGSFAQYADTDDQ